MTDPIQTGPIKAVQRETEVVPWGPNKRIISPETHPETKLTVLETIVLPGHSHAWHVHDESDEVIYVISGDGYATVGEGNRFPISRGDYIYIPTGTYHDTHNKGWAPLHLLVFYGPALAEQPADQPVDFQRAVLAPEDPLRWDTTFQPGDRRFTNEH